MAAWRDAPYFTDAERAALALTEAVTRLSDRADPVPDEIWNEAAQHYDEQELAALVLSIAMINCLEPAERHDPAGGGRVDEIGRRQGVAEGACGCAVIAHADFAM